MKLEDLLNARRTMDYAACSLPAEIFELAYLDYSHKLETYVNENKANHPEQLELFHVSEQNRIKQLAVFNRSGSNVIDQGDNDQIRQRAADLRPKSPGI